MIEAPEVIVDEDTHAYVCNGVAAPRSVTGLLKKYGITPDYSRIPAHIMDTARMRGKAVAVGCKYIAQGIEMNGVDQRIAPYLEAFRMFMSESGAEYIEAEIPRISPLGFGFTPDLICRINGVKTVVDGKATFKIPKSVGPQTAGYLIGFNSLFPAYPVEERAALWLKKDGTYKLQPLDDPDDATAFMDLLEADIKITNWERKYHE